MYRIDNSSAVSPIPTPGPVGPNPDSFFADGATVLPADWLNAVQEELANVVEDTGATLDKTDRTQLLTAINLIISTKQYGLRKLFRFTDQKTTGTAAQSLTGGAYTTRDLNTTSLNETDIVLGTNQLTLKAGSKYIINFAAPVGTGCTYSRAKIKSVSGDAIEVFGTSIRGDQLAFYDDIGTFSFVHNYKISPSVDTVIEIQHYVQSTGNGGYPVNYSTDPEIYTEVWGEQIG